MKISWKLPLLLAVASALSGFARAESCSNSSDMDQATRTAITSAAMRYFDMASKGDTASLRQNAIPALASDFSGIEGAVRDNLPNLAGVQATARPPFLLKAEGTGPLERAEFLCGIFNKNGQTSNSAVFIIPNLPPATYAIDALDVPGPKGNYTVTFVLQQIGTDWKIGGFYARPSQIGGHDWKWFADQARQYKAKGQTHNAWFYYEEARDLAVPVPFMSTLDTDKLYDEMQASKPSDLSPPPDLVVGTKTYKLNAIFPTTVGNDLDLVVKYQSADISNTAQTFQDNLAVMKALLAKYPEYREAFSSVVARAVAPNGQDYGTMMPMKDIK
ncbi:MAG TPA: hypothetical protein VFA68_00615 [Terriglobales bacterium]|nr:hypothetical protein [Terriglobales bacterium]